MHRATPANSSFRAYSAGGARSVVDKVDDKKLMQEMGGNFMHSETRDKIESPQNYGFSSVVHDADKDKDGKVTDGAETFISFMGGNRSFPVAGNMDDRRHRMFGMEKGDTAMFRGRGDKQQFHMTGDGGYWSAPQDKTVRMQLVSSNSESSSSQSGGGGVKATAAGAQGSGQEQQQGQKKERGQKPLYKDGQDSDYYVDVKKDETRVSGANARLLAKKKVLVDANGDGNAYLGGKAGDGDFSFVVTLDGPAKNSKAKVG